MEPLLEMIMAFSTGPGIRMRTTAARRRAIPGVSTPRARQGADLDGTSAMRPRTSSALSSPPASLRRPASLLLIGLLAALAAPGCHHEEGSHYTSVAEPPTVRLIQPTVRKIVRVVGQPSFIEA